MVQVTSVHTNMNREYIILFIIFPLYCDSWVVACVQLAWQFVTRQGQYCDSWLVACVQLEWQFVTRQGQCHYTHAEAELSQYKGKISRKLYSLFKFPFIDVTWPIYTYFTVWLLPYYKDCKLCCRQNTYPSSPGDMERSIYDLLAPRSTRYTRYIKYNNNNNNKSVYIGK